MISSVSNHPTDYFQALFESAPDLYLVLSTDLKIVAATDAYLKATLTRREQIIGRYLFEVFPDNPAEDKASGVNNLRSSLYRVLKTKEPDAMAVQKYDIPRPSSEGREFEERFWSPLNTPVLDQQGGISFIIHRVEDVTAFMRLTQQRTDDRKQAEELRSRTERMEGEIVQRAQQLQLANEKLREAERLKSEFFANVSHELRTPLSLILAPAESLLSVRQGVLPATQLHLVNIIHNNAVRLLQMVTGILDFTKAEAGRIEVHRRPTSIHRLIQMLTHDFQPMANQKGLSLFVQQPETEIYVNIDPHLLERILFNLLSNAIKFTSSGGNITVISDYDKDILKLTVKDNGIGIASKDLPILFQKFRQVESSSTRRFEGTGLGLALVREFTELMGGKVSVSSEPGVGSNFEVTIPAQTSGDIENETSPGIQRVRPSEIGTAITPGLPAFHPELLSISDQELVTNSHEELPKVLICEDNDQLATYIASLLQPICQIRTCHDGEKGMELVHSWTPDLVLTDMMMPRLDGIGLCSAIKADTQTAGTVVVLLTAQTHRQAMLRGWEAGADEYLFKPFHPDELVTRIRSLLAMVKERRAHAEKVEEKNRELALANLELEQKEQLRQYAQALERTNKELEEFAYISAHDMKSPIANVTGLLRMLEQKNGIKETNGPLFQMLKRSASQMQKRIEALNKALAFKKTLTLQSEKLRFENIFRDVCEGISELIITAGAQIHTDFSQCPNISFPLIHLKSIFQNLLTNAIKYAGDGPPMIDITSALEGQYTVLQVRDQGLGMDLKLFKDRIFHLFQRFHTHKEGSGIGLYLVYSIVDAYGGRIEVQSQPGKGTTFTIYFNNGQSK
jgi:signal transduction histidine kinase